MRNVFDQYTQPENKVTHALATALHEDKTLLNDFIKIFGHKGCLKSSLEVVEQQIPGEAEITEDAYEERGLPDAWIFDDNDWSLLIESKVQATLTKGQITRHYKTALRYGFEKVLVLAIDVKPPSFQLPSYCKFIYWSDVYSWLIKHSTKAIWAAQVVRYFEIAETRFVETGYMTEGALTTFTGIPFDKDTPYNYLEAKRILKLLMGELKKEKRLSKELGLDLNSSGRGAITGKSGDSVWDYLPMKIASESNNHTDYPHFTISISRERLFALVTMPHRIKTQFRNNLIKPGYDYFYNIFGDVTRNFSSATQQVPNAVPTVEVVQRRYKTQRSIPNIDALLSYDLRTAFNEKSIPVKEQPNWLESTYQVFNPKKGNTQLVVGMVFNFKDCSNELQSKKIVNSIVDSWIACKPFVKALIEGEQS